MSDLQKPDPRAREFGWACFSAFLLSAAIIITADQLGHQWAGIAVVLALWSLVVLIPAFAGDGKPHDEAAYLERQRRSEICPGCLDQADGHQARRAHWEECDNKGAGSHGPKPAVDSGYKPAGTDGDLRGGGR